MLAALSDDKGGARIEAPKSGQSRHFTRRAETAAANSDETARSDFPIDA